MSKINEFRAWICMDNIMIYQGEDKEKHHEHYYIGYYGGEMLVSYEPDTCNWLIKSEIMQFTGLYDCKRTDEYPNGQKIYEGDIVSNRYETRAKVVFQDGRFKLYVFNPPYGHKRMTDIMNFINTSCLVVGNIYEGE